MRRRHSVFTLLITGLLLANRLAAEDYRWIITYPNATNDWSKLVASGENKVAMKAQFIKITAADYNLIKFAVRPLQEVPPPLSFPQDWLIDSLQLWINTDEYPGSLDQHSDSLLSTAGISIESQSTPVSAVVFNLPASQISLEDTTTFFVTMIFHNFHDTTRDNREISYQNGYNFGITVVNDPTNNNDDLLVTPSNKTANNWSGSSALPYQFRAVNLPVVVYNRNKSSAEDSVRFYPNYQAMTGSTVSKNEIITDLSFSAYINLPHSNLQTEGEEDRLSYASFKIKWDNSILQLDSLRYGEIWQNKAYSSEGSGFGVVEIDTDPKYSIVRFEGLVMDDTNYVDIDYNDLAVLDFRVIKPGISPIILSDIEIIDQWGIPYHVYQNISNETAAAAPRCDAWAKFILGDCTAGSSSDLLNGVSDGQVDATDITLFSNYIWLSPDSTEWYERFDIGSPDSHDPDELSPDDTTNFYDLMWLATNYFRSYTGAFAQKTAAPKPVTINLLSNASAGQEYYVSINFQHLDRLAAAQLQLGFDPAVTQFLGVKPGALVEASAPQNLLLWHAPSLARGIIDINFITLADPISGEGEFAVIHLRQIAAAVPQLQLITADLRNACGQQISTEAEMNSIVLPEKFLTPTNYPNPFNSATTIRFNIPLDKSGDFSLNIYDLRGHLVRSLHRGQIEAGSYSVVWDGKNQFGQPVVSGIYLLHLKSAQTTMLHKITLIR